jgi:hypothetical protein
VLLLLVGTGLAVAQPPQPEQPGQQPYQLVLEPVADPQVRPLTLGQPQARTFGEGSSVDDEGNLCEVWTLQVEQAQTVRLAVTSADGDPAVKLFDTPKVFDADPLAENDDMSGGLDALLDYPLFPGPTYYVMVVGRFEGDAAGSYTLMATAFTPPSPRPLPWNETVEGHLGAPSASLEGQYCDDWTFSVKDPQVVLVALEDTEAARLNVFVGPPKDGQTAQEQGSPGLRQRIEARPGLDYHVAVLATESEADYRLRLGPYTALSLPPTTPLPADQTADGELTEEDLTFFGAPCDVWQIDGGDGRRVTLTCSSEEADPVLSVFDTPDFVMLADDPNVIKALASDDDGGGGTTAHLSFDAEAGRTYYVLAMGYSVGKYQLQSESAPLPPLKKLPLGEEVTSTLAEAVEVWELTAPAAGLVTVQMKSAEFDAYVEIKPGRTSSKVLAEDDDSGGEFNAAVSFLAEANQTYYVHARASEIVGEGGGGTYTLEATRIDVPPTQPLTPGAPVNGTVPTAPDAVGPGWTFTAPATQRILLRLSDLEFSPHVIVRQGGPAGKVVAESQFSNVVVFQAEAGTVYHVQIGASEAGGLGEKPEMVEPQEEEGEG